MNRFLRTGLLCAALFPALGLTSNAATQSLAPDAVIAGATTYDGQLITVSGTAKNVQTRTTPRGTFSHYDLCSTQCVHVMDRSGNAVTEGSNVTVSGTFHAQLQRPGGMGGAGGWHGGQSGGWQSHHGNFPTTDVLIVRPPNATQ